MKKQYSSDLKRQLNIKNYTKFKIFECPSFIKKMV